MTGHASNVRIARPDTRWERLSSAYAGNRMHADRDDTRAVVTTTGSWMGGLAATTGECSHPGFDLAAIHAKGWQAGSCRNPFRTITLLEEDAGPAMHPVQQADTEKARCANTGLLRSSLDWMLSGTRLDRRQTA